MKRREKQALQQEIEEALEDERVRKKENENLIDEVCGPFDDWYEEAQRQIIQECKDIRREEDLEDERLRREWNHRHRRSKVKSLDYYDDLPEED